MYPLLFLQLETQRVSITRELFNYQPWWLDSVQYHVIFSTESRSRASSPSATVLDIIVEIFLVT